ncbi:MAG: hypothetical protein ABI273_10440, partial [Lacunisphaera sp.]
MDPSPAPNSASSPAAVESRLIGKRVAVIAYSIYLLDPRVRRAAAALAAQGMDVDVLCISENAGEPSSETVEGVNIFRVSLTFQRQSKWIYLWQYARFFAASAWFLTRR